MRRGSGGVGRTHEERASGGCGEVGGIAHSSLARNSTDLSEALTRADMRQLWQQLALHLNTLGPPTKSSKQWKEHWSWRVMKARKRAAQLNEAARKSL